MKKTAQGFTLIELMVTITIIGILAAVGLVVFSSAQKTARVSKRVQDLKALRTALELYKTSTGSYPINATAVCAQTATGAGSIASLIPTYLSEIPKDPISTNCYWYQSDANGFEYKIRTGGATATAANSDLVTADYKTQTSMIDPSRDSGAAADCILDYSGNVTGWAFYTTGGCGY